MELKKDYIVELREDEAEELMEEHWVGELVRCKDCKHWSSERINEFNKCRRWINVGVKNFATLGDWFCADGEKEEMMK